MIARWLGQTEGRDKLCKVLQYLCRLLSVFFSQGNPYRQLKFQTLFESLKEARKLFRLFKFIEVYKEIIHDLFNSPEQLRYLMLILAKVGYFLYAIFDNISAASQVKLFVTLDHKKYERVASRFKIVAVLLSILAHLYSVLILKEKDKRVFSLKCLRNMAELLPTCKDAGVGSLAISEALSGLGGLFSGCAATYQIYTVI